MYSHIASIVNYNLWANKNLIEMLRTCNDDLISQNIVSSFPSIRKTLEHIWGVENGWLKSMLGTPEEYFLEFQGSHSELYSALIEGSEKYADFCINQSSEQLSSHLTLQIQDRKYSFQFQRAIQHCMNHSTHHRGQIVTMARQIGLEEITAELGYIEYVTITENSRIE